MDPPGVAPAMKDAIAGRLAPGQPGRSFRCHACPTTLATFDLSGLHLHPALTRLDRTEDGMPVYGVRPELRSRHRRGHERREPDSTRRLPLVAYCPACRAKNRVAD
jgi:hypothetical protein